MKKLGGICAAVLLCGVLTGCLWNEGQNSLESLNREYPIVADLSNLEEHLNARLGEEGVEPEFQTKVLEIYDRLDLEEKRMVLIEVDVPSEQSRLGIAELELGPNSQYKLGFISHTTQNILCEITEGNDKEYLLIAGRNQDKITRKIVSTQEGKEFSVEIPEKELFIVAVPAENAKKLWEYDPNSWRFYNAAGEDITAAVEW